MSSGTEKPKALESDDDAAGGRFWEIYFNEAREYDVKLVTGWKEDMDVILVFSGLYSAVLTAFVIESYQKLQEDSADVSAQLLKTISRQLAAPSSALDATQTLNDPFTPTASALACNLLWFISLSLSLICAFLAMFIQQWCRHFMHRTTIGRSPTARARLIQFFYFGLKRYRMHIIVDVIPYLLHISLFNFFGGLSAFLWTISRPLAWLILAFLAALLTLYTVITLLPVFSLSSPFQTPLSSLVWRLLQVVKRLSIHWPRQSSRATDPEKGPVIQTHSTRLDTCPARGGGTSVNEQSTLLDAMVKRGVQCRSIQESKSIAWILRSLNDEGKFLSFIEALPDVLENYGGFRLDNLHLLEPILRTPNPRRNVIARANWLLLNAGNLWHSNEYRERCRAGVSAFFSTLFRFLFTPSKELTGDKFGFRRNLKFPKEMISSLRTEDPLHNPKQNYSLSIMVLCLLQNCLSIDETLRKAVDTQELDDLIKTGNVIFKDYAYKSDHGFVTAGWQLVSESNLILADVASHLFGTYLQVAGIHFPLGFNDVCHIFNHLGIKPTNPNRGTSDGLLATITFQLYLINDKSRRINSPSLDEFDSIFKVILKSSIAEDLPGIASYVSRRVELGWWAPTAWQDEEMQQLCNLLTEALDVSASAYRTAAWADACKWIIVYGQNCSRANRAPIQSMLECMAQSPDMENHPASAFFVRLTIVKNYNHDQGDVYGIAHRLVLKNLIIDQRFNDLIMDTDPMCLEPYIDRRFGSIIKPRRAEICSKERGIYGSLLLIQALTTHLSLSECRQILEFFHHLDFPVDSASFIARQPSLLRELVKTTEEYCQLWVSNPSTDLFDINRMLWRIWRSIVSDGPWKDPNPWRDLDPELYPNQRHLNLQRDPGPWGDPNPWMDPDPSCVRALCPLRDLATDILSTPQETLGRMNGPNSRRHRIRLFTGIDDFDLISDARSVREHLFRLSRIFAADSVSNEFLSNHLHLKWS